MKKLLRSKKTRLRALVALVLAAFFLSFLPAEPGGLAAFDGTANAVDVKEALESSAAPASLSDGQVWTGKSVTYSSAADDIFTVTLSALGQKYNTTTGEPRKVNVALVLDVSGSMLDDSKIQNAVSAANTAIANIHNLNGENKVGVVTFSGGAGTLVGLTVNEFTLSFNSSNNKVGNSVNNNKTSVTGGTNIQAGMNQAYWMLKAAANGGDTAKPVIILLTDGVPCYYSSNYQSIPVTSDYPSSGWQQDGNGYLSGQGASTGLSDTGMTAAAYTIRQAAYLKSALSGLEIYTIGYGTGSNLLANATLNPTENNIAACNGGSSQDLYQRLGCSSAAEAAALYCYPSGSYSGTSVDIAQLTNAFAGIIEDISSSEPLADGSFVTVTDTVGDDFKISGSLTMALKSGTYTLTDSNGDGTYEGGPAGVSVVLSGTQLTWTFPASELYCLDPGTASASGAAMNTLSFNVELKNGVSGVDYYTNYSDEAAFNSRSNTPGAAARFEPALGNTYYYDVTPGSMPSYPTSNWSITINRSGSKGNRTYTLVSLSQGGTPYSFTSSTVTRQGNNKKYDITVTLADGTVLFFDNEDFKWNGQNGNQTRTCDADNIDYSNTQPIPPTYTPKSIPGFTGGVATLGMPGTGHVRLKTCVGDLTITKAVEAYDGQSKGPLADTGFNFSLSAGNYTGTGTIYNADNTTAGTFAINGGSATFTLKDGQYAKVSALPVGTAYTVTENDYTAQGYETAAAVSAGNGQVSGRTVSGTVVALGNALTFTNTYYPSATIAITKNVQTLYEGVTIPPGVTFPFGLYKQNNDGSYSPITGVTASVTTNGGSTYTAQMAVRVKTLADAGLFGSGSTATVYVHEESMTGDPTGWTPDGSYVPVTIDKSGNVSYGSANSAVFTNQYVPTSTLTLTKAVQGGAAPEGGFDFTVTLGVSGGPSFQFSYTVNRAGGVQETGQGTSGQPVELSLGESDNAVFTGVPVGAPYAITEDDYGSLGFAPSVGQGQSMTGTVAAGGTAVTVTNTLYKNDIKVGKIAVGGDPQQTFEFTLMRGQSVYTGFEYSIGENTYTSSNGKFTLSGGQTAVLKDLPVGATYTVVETANSAYETENSLNGGNFTSGSSCSVLLQAGGTAPEMTFRNTYKTGSLTVAKSVLIDGSSPEVWDETYAVSVSFSGGYLAGILAPEGAEQTGDGQYTLSLAAGGFATFSNVPAGASYTVAENNSQGADIVSYSPAASGTIAAGANQTVTVVNSYLTPATLTISKSVSSANNLSFDSNTAFDFSIFFYTQTEGEEGTQTIPYVLAQDETPPGLTAGAQPGYYTFSLKGGESISFNALPVGVMFEVMETNDNGARDSHASVVSGGAHASVDQSNDLRVTGTIPQDPSGQNPIAIQYVNDFSVTPGTLTLTKTVSDPAGLHTGGFEFAVAFTGQTAGITCSDSGASVAVYGNTVVFSGVTVQANGSVSFSGLLDGTQYAITEITQANGTAFTGAASTGTDGEGRATASGVMALSGWTVQDVAVNCANTYDPPTTSTEKTASAYSVHTGTPVGYTVTVTNTGNVVLELRSIEDNMLPNAADIRFNGRDTGFTLDLDNGDGTPAPRVLTGGYALQPGQSATLTYTVAFNSFGEMQNTAMSRAWYHNYEATSSDTATVRVYPDSAISVSKQVRDEGDYYDSVSVDYLDTVTYKVTISNDGQAALSQVKLSDALLSDGTFSLVSAKLGDVDLYVEISGNEMRFYTDSALTQEVVLEAGQSIEVTYTVKASSDHVNTASASAFDGVGVISGSDTASVAIVTPTVSVEKSADKDTVFTGETVTYTVTVTNTYTQILDLVSVTDTMFRAPDGGEYQLDESSVAVTVDGVALGSGDFSLDTSTGTISFAKTGDDGTTYPSIGPSGTAVITYTVIFDKAGTYANTASATVQFRGMGAADSDDEDNGATVEVKDPENGITVDKRANGAKATTVTSGSVVTYTVMVTNAGDLPIVSLELTDPMFAVSGLTITGAVLTNGSTTTDLAYTRDGDKVIIDLPWGGEDEALFVPGATVTLTYTMAMTSTYTNNVTATALNAREDSATDSSSATVNVTYSPPPVTPTPTPSPSPTPTPSPSPSPSPSEEPSPSPSDTGIAGDVDKPGGGDDAGVAGEVEKLPQTGGVSPLTVLGLIGIALASIGGAIYVVFGGRKHRGESR